MVWQVRRYILSTHSFLANKNVKKQVSRYIEKVLNLNTDPKGVPHN